MKHRTIVMTPELERKLRSAIEQAENSFTDVVNEMSERDFDAVQDNIATVNEAHAALRRLLKLPHAVATASAASSTDDA